MGVKYNPSIVTADLGLCVDASATSSLNNPAGTWKDVSGNQLNFSGNSSYLSSGVGLKSGSSWTTSTTQLLNTDCHSIFFAVRFNSSTTYPNGHTGSWEQILVFNAGGSDRTPGIWRYPSQRYIHWRYDPSNSGCDFGKNSSNQDFDIDTWYYVGVTKNGASTTQYVNGVQVGTGSVSSPKTRGTAAITLFPYYTDSLANIGCLHIYNRPLTSTEVLQNFNAIRKDYNI